ncbi:hypothetical protein GJR96_14850 [Haloferax sp. MBLA0076]|uniref:Uncharacterized protein n=1 Tax=Haloferax litoreum TaxID=2666140 RepID=A0A6A8GK44_9EURY|nr:MULTISPECIES: hypothetical protein [Haloferax]KAB1194650.1 hypothetical protein Hfx1148_14780 [Haloferax sp. CBA1148]MRX23229.1 hypothetical protein [Haloferax litoreum]
MSLAADARDAVRERPFLLAALRAGVVNYAAAAAYLDLGDDDAVAAALRRFADDLSDLESESREVTVTMRSGVGLVGEDIEESDGDPVLSVAGVELAGGGPLTAIIAEGDVGTDYLTTVLSRLDAESVVVDAAGVAGDSLAVVVPRRQGAAALRIVESASESVYV